MILSATRTGLSPTLSRPLPPSCVYGNRYVLLGEVGRGGSARVYRARDLSTGTIVAIKQLCLYGLHPAAQAAARACFLQEARILSRIHHPRIPRLYDQFTTDIPWLLVLDYLEGEPLDQVLARTRGILPLECVCSIGLQLCAILSVLHQREQPILHRDLKPANVLLQADNSIFLVDFGLAGPQGQEPPEALGTEGYAAPEQYPDRNGRSRTMPASDIYSLGVMLSQLLTGRVLPRGPRAALRTASPDAAGVAALLRSMCARRPEERPALADIAAQLASFGGHHTCSEAERMVLTP